MKSFRLMLTILGVAALAGCATVAVNSDYDPGTDFSNLKTYQWASQGPQKTGDPRVDDNSLLHIRIKTAVDSELALKGFQKRITAAPDFVVNYHVSAKDKTDVQSFGPTHYGSGYYGGYRRAGGGFPGSHSVYGSGTVTTFHYTEGTLLIDIIDPKAKKLLWRGTGTKVVDPNATSEQKTATVKDAVAKILAKFPPENQ